MAVLAASINKQTLNLFRIDHENANIDYLLNLATVKKIGNVTVLNSTPRTLKPKISIVNKNIPFHQNNSYSENT